MGFDPERALLTRVLEEGDLRAVVRSKITPDFFNNDDTREVYAWVVNQYEDLGKIPSLTLVQERFPDFQPEGTDDDLRAIIQSIKDKRLYIDLQTCVKKIAGEARMGPDEGLNMLRSEAARLSITYSEGAAIDATQFGSEILRLYRLNKKKKGLLGQPWPWKPLNDATRGIRKGSFNAIYSQPGAMKTWLLIYIADYAHQLGVRPVFFTYEMPIEDIQIRWSCMRARVDYRKWQTGTLSDKEFKEFRSALEEMKDDPPFIIEELENVGASALTELRSKVQDHNANLVLIDGLAFLADDLEWRPWDMMLRSVKTYARSSRIPIVATHHTNRQHRKERVDVGSEVEDVALGDSLFRHTDVLIRIQRSKTERAKQELALVTRKVREGEECKFFIHALPAYNFSFKYVVDQDTNYDDEKGATNGKPD